MGLDGKQQRYRRGEFLMESGGTLVFAMPMWGYLAPSLSSSFSSFFHISFFLFLVFNLFSLF
jgi:hypothetical protein